MGSWPPTVIQQRSISIFTSLGSVCGKQVIEGQLSVEAVDFFKLERMVVIGELDPGFFRGFADSIAGFREALVAVGSARLCIEVWAYQEFLADDVCAVDNLLQIRFERKVLLLRWRRSWMCADGEVRPFESSSGANFLRRLAVVAGEFDFFVADFRDAGDGAVEVLLHEPRARCRAADLRDRCDGRLRRPKGACGGGDHSSGNGCFDEGSSVHGG